MNETGNSSAGEYQRTTTGGGSYSLTASGAGLSNSSGSTGYTLTETANPLSGDFSQAQTGTTRYDLLQGFNNVSDTSGTSTPGHLNFVPYGVAFVDPFRLFGVTWVAPWNPNAQWGWEGAKNYGKAVGVAASGIGSGAAAGAATGAATGAAAGAVGGAIAGAGVGTAPGAAAGATAGAVGGGIAGAFSGLIRAAVSNDAGEAAIGGLKDGAVAGAIAGPVAGGVKVVQLTRAAAAAKAAPNVDLNKLYHIFGKAQHNLGPLVQEFGSEASAYQAMQQAAEAVVKQKGITGVFEEVQVGTQQITVRGNVVNGAVKIGTAFK